jgi:hypothetical protein
MVYCKKRWTKMVNGDFSGNLKSLMEEYDRRIADAEREVERLRQLRNAAALLLENETGRPISKPTTEKPYAGMITIQAVESVLRKNGNRPMHASELTTTLIAGGWHTTASNPQLTVVGALVRDGRFERTAPNTFRLIEKGGNEARS